MWVVVLYEKQWYPGRVVQTTLNEVEVECLERIPSKQDNNHFRSPSNQKDCIWYPNEAVVCPNSPPVSISK
jgi:hypothetical protein